jgi:hypothetical protein
MSIGDSSECDGGFGTETKKMQPANLKPSEGGDDPRLDGLPKHEGGRGDLGLVEAIKPTAVRFPASEGKP